MYKVDFLESARIETQWPCPVCGAASASVGLTIDSGIAKLGVQELAECDACGSWFFLGENPVIGYRDAMVEPNYWMHYVQVGAGIEGMLRPIMMLGEKARGTFLDVGCGFGFVPDFWEKSGRGPAAGLEMAEFGKMGKRLLDVKIYQGYLDDCEEIRGRTFDVVYSSEVIEHVRNPRSFLQGLANALKPEGMLVLSTPSASCVRPDTDKSSLHAALSPGLHYFLLTRERLELLLEEAGFPYHMVEDNGLNLRALASRAPFAPPDRSIFDWREYFSYLEKVSEYDNPHLRGGMLYRLFRDGMNTGQMDVAAFAFDRLETHAKNVYGIDLTYPNITEALQSTNFLVSTDRYPAWLGALLLMSGFYAGNVLHDAARKLRLLEASTHMLKHEMECGFQFAQEAAALLPVAVYNYRIALADCLRAEVPRGLDREITEEFSRPNNEQIENFRQRLSDLAGTIDAFAPSGLNA